MELCAYWYLKVHTHTFDNGRLSKIHQKYWLQMVKSSIAHKTSDKQQPINTCTHILKYIWQTDVHKKFQFS